MSVYQPAEDSHMLAEIIGSLDLTRKTACDVGCGSGILSKALVDAGASVTSVDINPEAVAATESLVPSATVIESNMFEEVSGMFDVIVCNAPYLPEHPGEDADTALQVSGGKHGMAWTWQFLEEAITRLSPSGSIYLMTSSLARLDLFEKSLLRYGLSGSIVKERSVGVGERLLVYKLTFFLGLSQALKESFLFSSFVGKGTRGIVFGGMYNDEFVVCKVFPEEGSAAREASQLELVNEHNIGPTYHFHTSHALIMSHVSGSGLHTVYPSLSVEDKLLVIKQLIEKCLTLDTIGLNKEEMLRPYQNALVDNSLHVVLIDFERSRKSDRPTNLTQLAQFIFRQSSSEVQQVVRDHAQAYRSGKMTASEFATVVFDTFKKSEYQ